jgi:hypothetical protein
MNKFARYNLHFSLERYGEQSGQNLKTFLRKLRPARGDISPSNFACAVYYNYLFLLKVFAKMLFLSTPQEVNIYTHSASWKVGEKRNYISLAKK